MILSIINTHCSSLTVNTLFGLTCVNNHNRVCEGFKVLKKKRKMSVYCIKLIFIG
jgi:hypothetical protein